MGYSITLEDLTYLQSTEGQEKLKELSLLDLSSLKLAGIIQKLRKSLTVNQTSALIETVRLRRRAKEKFSKAYLMYFLEDALEQATGEVISSHRAKRFLKYKRVADLTCGIGGDLMSLARVCSHVVAIERDEIRFEMAKANMKALGLFEKVDFYCEDLRKNRNVDAAFADPGRRSEGKRLFRTDRLIPPLNDLLKLREDTQNIGIKLFPGIPREEIPRDCEAEFISHNGICKEAVLWFGGFKRNTHRRATILPEGIEIEAEDTEPVKAGDPLDYIYEPDPAIIRAGMVEWLAWFIRYFPLPVLQIGIDFRV